MCNMSIGNSTNASSIKKDLIMKKFLCFNVFDVEGSNKNVSIQDYCVITLSGKPETFKDKAVVEKKLQDKLRNLCREDEDFYESYAKLGYIELPDEVTRYTKPMLIFDKNNYDTMIAKRSMNKILNSTAKEEMDRIYGNSEE